jgi:hypothetical protein
MSRARAGAHRKNGPMAATLSKRAATGSVKINHT